MNEQKRKEIQEWYGKDTPSSLALDSNDWRDSIDPFIVDIINFLNALPGCATKCSCAGKGPRPATHSGRTTEHPPNDNAYVWMVCDDFKSMFLLMAAREGVKGDVILYVEDQSLNLLFPTYEDMRHWFTQLQALKDQMDSGAQMIWIVGSHRIENLKIQEDAWDAK